MPTVTIPLAGKTYRNVDGIELSDDASKLFNGYISEKKGIVRIPGLVSFLDLGLGVNHGIDGLFWWTKNGCLIAVSNGRIYKITYFGGVATAVDLTGDTLTPGAPVSFAVGPVYLFMANGGKIVYTDGSAVTAYMADADCPTTVTDVGWLDTYVLAAKAGTAEFYWTDVGSSSSWNALSYASALGDGDNISRMKVMNREILLFGPASLEIWQNDGTTPFSRITGGMIQIGCIAPNSIVELDRVLYWLDHNRRIVAYKEGGQTAHISTPFDKELDEFSNVTDCRGETLKIDGKHFLLFLFPTVERALLYNVSINDWSELGQWDSDNMQFNQTVRQRYAYAPTWGKHIIGHASNSILYEQSGSAYDDAGETLRLLRITGHIDYGTFKQKRSNKITLKVKSGYEGTTITPKLMLRWRDDGAETWSNEHWLSLKPSGDSNFIATLERLGIYQTRQYELAATDAVPIIISKAEEDLDILR